MIKDLLDFRGGYATDVTSELMSEKELLTAENCQWREGLVKRNGLDKYSTTDLSGQVGMKGAIRAYINSTWYTITALDDDSFVHFYYSSGNATTLTVINADFHFTKAINVSFAALNGHVVACNGSNKPAVIYWDGAALAIQNLEAHDTVTRDWANWWAGQWDDDGTPQFIDDSADAYSTTADDFAIFTLDGTEDNGCYIACDYSFNKVIFKSAEQAGGSPVAEYCYWNGSAWTAITPTTSPTWTAAAGDRTLEFDLPFASDGTLAWLIYEDDTDTDNNATNRYILRIRFTTAASATFSCDYLTVQNTQYLSQILYNEKPTLCYTFNNQMFLASGNSLNMSPYNQVTGWKENMVEYFAEGGEKIMDMCGYNNVLCVLKESTIYTLDLSNYLDPIRSKPLAYVGTVARRSARQIGNFVAFVARDGIYLFDGTKAMKASKHIQTDIDSYTLTNACSVVYENEYWVSFPTNSIVLTFDPDTFRIDDAGDPRVSFYKFTSYKIHQFIPFENEEAGTTPGYLIGVVDQSTPYLVRCNTGATDDLTGSATTAISMTIMTKYIFGASPQTLQYYGRLKPKVKQVSSSTGATHAFTFYSEDGTVNATHSMTVTTGSGYYSEDISLPYTLDGKNFAIKLVHSAATAAGLISLSYNTEERRF